MKKENLKARKAKKLLKGRQDMDSILKSRLGFYLKNLFEMKYTKELPYVINIRNREIALENNPRYPEGIDDDILAPYNFVIEDRKKIIQKELRELTDKMEEADRKRLDAEEQINEEKNLFEEKVRNMEYLTPENANVVKDMLKSKYKALLKVFFILIIILIAGEFFSLFQQFSDFYEIGKNDTISTVPLNYIKTVFFSSSVFIILFVMAHWIYKLWISLYSNYINNNQNISQSIKR